MSAFNNEKLKEIRKQAGYTQEKIARLIGIARTTYAEYEQGKIQPPLDNVERICRLFNISSTESLVISSIILGLIEGAGVALIGLTPCYAIIKKIQHDLLNPA